MKYTAAQFPIGEGRIDLENRIDWYSTKIYRIVISLFVILAFPFCLTAQNSLTQAAQQWKMGGNSPDTNAFIGTTNSSPLRFYSGNTERMRMDSDGNLGLGLRNPETTLDVEGDIQLTGDISFKKYFDPQIEVPRLLMLDQNGVTNVTGANYLRTIFSKDDCYEEVRFSGAPTMILPDWAATSDESKSILYTGTGCPTWVGIGTDDPVTKLDVWGNGRFKKGLAIAETIDASALFYIKGSTAAAAQGPLILVNNSNGESILRLDNGGLLRSREIIVDQKNWSDYVFDDDYVLMPLKEVQRYIQTNGHLPNIPSAQEIKENGLDLSEAAKKSMEKIEELTLYLIELDEKLEQQNQRIKEQSILLLQQKETIQLQQELLQKLEQERNQK